MPSKITERALGLCFQILLQIVVYEGRMEVGDPLASFFLTLNMMIILSLSPVMLVVSTTVTQNILVYLISTIDTSISTDILVDIIFTLITINAQAMILIL